MNQCKNTSNSHHSICPLIVTLIVFSAMVVYLYSERSILSHFKNIDFLTVICLVILQALFLLVNGLILKEFLLRFDIHLSVKKWFGLSVVTAMSNYLTPFGGGIVARATYLKYRYIFPYSKFLSLLATNYLISFATISILGIFNLVLFWKSINFHFGILLFFIMVVFAIATLILKPHMNITPKNRIMKAVMVSLEGLESLKQDKLLIFKIVIYQIVNLLLSVMSFWIAYSALGYHVPFVVVFTLTILTSFSIFINLTPGNLGTQESIISLLSGLLGTGVGAGLLVALVIRASTILPVFILGPIFSYVLTKDLTSYKAKALLPQDDY